MTLALRLPDFNQPPPRKAPPPPDPALLEAVRVEAEAAGHATGHAEGLAEGLAQGRAMQAAEQEAAIQRALVRLAEGMDKAAEAGRRTAEESAEALAEMLAAVLDHALPGACATSGAEIVAHLLVPLLPAIADRPEAVLRVAPDLAEAIAARMPPRGPEVVADAAIAPGDARLAWRDGALVVSLEARRTAVAEALRAAGIRTKAEGDSA